MTEETIKLQPREPNTPQLVNVLHSPKRVRAIFAGQTIADSRETLILRSNQFLPTYFFPLSVVRQEFLIAQDVRTCHQLGGELRHWGLEAEGRHTPDAAWSFLSVEDSELASLRGFVAFNWKAVDQWFEEDEEIFVHPRDPYARIDTLQSSSHVQIRLDGELIADSKRPVLLFETHLPTRYYIPADDIRMDRLVASDSKSQCPYKGIASYWSAKAPDGSRRKDVAWSYVEPLTEIPKIRGLIAFYPQAVDEIRIDGNRVS